MPVSFPVADLGANDTFAQWFAKTNELVEAVNDLNTFDISVTAADVTFDPAGIDLASTDVQAAVTEAYDLATENAIAFAIVLG